MDIFIRTTSRSEHKFEPSWPLSLSSGFSAAQKISFGHDTDQSAGSVDYGESAYSMLQHHASRVFYGRVRQDGDNSRRHDLGGFHQSSISNAPPCLAIATKGAHLRLARRLINV